MSDRHHRIAHACLAGVYALTAGILVLEASFGHAACALAAAAIYWLLARHPGGHAPL